MAQTQQQIYESWKGKVVGKGLDIDHEYRNQCVDVVLSYGLSLFPGVSYSTVFPPVLSAKLLLSHANPKYFEVIKNDHNDPRQIPEQGDIMVFDATPEVGYSNKTDNQDGHTGVCDSANSVGYTLLMQDGSNPNGVTFLQTQPWKFRPCLGWLRPKLASSAAPAPKPAPVPAKKQTVTLPKEPGLTWAFYREGSGLVKGSSDQIGTLLPGTLGPLTYDIISWVGDYAVNIKTQQLGTGTIWVKNTDAIIK